MKKTNGPSPDEFTEEQDFQSKIFESFKSNLTLSLLAFCFNQSIDSSTKSSQEKKEFRQNFLKFWKRGMQILIQGNLQDVNDNLIKNNNDFIDIITKNKTPSTEDYQRIYSRALKDCEDLFWKMMDDSDDSESWVNNE